MESAQLRQICFATLSVAVIAGSVFLFLPFLPSVLWAVVLSILMRPLHSRLLGRFRRSKYGESIAALGTTLATLFVIGIPLLMIGILATSQASVALNEIQGQNSGEVLAKVDDALKPLVEKLGVQDFHISEWWLANKGSLVTSLKVPATKLATQLGTGTFTMVVAFLSMFFFLRDGKSLLEPFYRLCGLPEERANGLLKKLYDTVHAVFSGTVLVAIVQGTIMGITYALLGVPNSVLLGIVSIVLCIIPLLGAPVIYLPVGMLFLSQGQTNKALIVFGVGFLIVSQIDNLLKPLLIGNKVALHPLAIFFFVLGGIGVFGPVGLMVGPMILVVLLTFYESLAQVKSESMTLDSYKSE
jgi:predicted PurR-regulated permease PerM